MTANTERTIEEQVKQIFLNAGWATAPYMSVRACESGSSMWRRKPNGAFNINVWGAKSNLNPRSRDHMFRTKKDGSFTADTLDKIKEFAVFRLTTNRAQAAAEKARESAKVSNAVTAQQLRDYAKAKTGSYYSEYKSSYGGYISEDSGVEGKVSVNVGSMALTQYQATQLIDLMASFK